MAVQLPSGLNNNDIIELCNGTSIHLLHFISSNLLGKSNSSLGLQLQRQACLKKHYYALVYPWRWFYSWAVPLFMIFGTVGTTLCLIVLTRRRTTSTQREIRCWFIALSFFDIYVLIIGLSVMYIRKTNIIIPGLFEDHWDLYRNRTYDPMDLNPKGYNAFMCHSISILNYFGLLTSSWLQAGISVLRALSTLLPLMTRARLHRKVSTCALIATIIASALAAVALNFSSVRYHLDPQTKKYECDSGSGKAGRRFFYISLHLKVILPSICLLISSILIVRSLRELRRNFGGALSRNKVVGSPSTTNNANELLNAGTSQLTSQNTSQINKKKNGWLKKLTGTQHAASGAKQSAAKTNTRYYHGRDSRISIGTNTESIIMCRKLHQRRISYILLGMNTTFLIFTLPYEIHGLYKSSLAGVPSRANITLEQSMAIIAVNAQRLATGQLLNFFIYTNNATNWLFYFMLGKHFRNNVLALITMKPLLRCLTMLRKIGVRLIVTCRLGCHAMCSSSSCQCCSFRPTWCVKRCYPCRCCCCCGFSCRLCCLCVKHKNLPLGGNRSRFKWRSSSELEPNIMSAVAADHIESESNQKCDLSYGGLDEINFPRTHSVDNCSRLTNARQLQSLLSHSNEDHLMWHNILVHAHCPEATNGHEQTTV